MTIAHVVRGPLLNPRTDGSVAFIPDAALIGDERGKIVAVGRWNDVAAQYAVAEGRHRAADGWILPPMLDAHIHIPQHPIRGRFLEGISGSPPGGPLLAGLERNVFPAEGRCADPAIARAVIEAFREGTLAHGVIGGAAYMTVHTAATRDALEMLPPEWFIGLVLMEQFCPTYLRTDEANLDRDVASLASDFGQRLIVTDRFAGAVDSPLRRGAVELSRRFNLRMQTHLNEQRAEKAWIEELYPDAASYTDVYRLDGLLQRAPILAHCIQMRPEEYELLATAKDSGAAVAHCPVSNTLLGSGVMSLDEIAARNIPFALCTDVGASPTTSLLCEMLQFLRVHCGRSKRATPEEALFRVTLAAAQILGLADRLGSFEPGKDLSFIEVACRSSTVGLTSGRAILECLLESDDADLSRYAPDGELGDIIEQLRSSGLPVGAELGRLTDNVSATAKRLDEKVLRVTLSGREVWRRSAVNH
jgi:guanine deaminase